MKKQTLKKICVMALLIAAVLIGVRAAKAQTQGQIAVPPYQLFRFRISNMSLGYLLTPSFSEGTSHGYIFDNIFANQGGTGGIYPVPAPGYTPDPSVCLIPLYRWTVIEHGRPYTYYSTHFANLGPNYHFDYIQGYVFPAGQTSHTFANGFVMHLSRMSSFYSQDFGYWNGSGTPGFTSEYFEPPPNGTFRYQDNVCAMPLGLFSTVSGPVGCAGCVSFHQFDVIFNPPASPPPPPPPTCEPMDRQYCVSSGGQWDSSSCSCSSEGGGGMLQY